MTQPLFKARPTTYKGIAMRSRLEAKFAAYLDETGSTWEYEPRAYAGNGGQYLPDFEVGPSDDPFFVEVKPTRVAAFRTMERMQVIWESLPTAVLSIYVADGSCFTADPLFSRKWVSLRLPGWEARCLP